MSNCLRARPLWASALEEEGVSIGGEASLDERDTSMDKTEAEGEGVAEGVATNEKDDDGEDERAAAAEGTARCVLDGGRRGF